MKTGIFLLSLILICTFVFVLGTYADIPNDSKVLVIGIPFLIVLAIAASLPFNYIGRKKN